MIQDAQDIAKFIASFYKGKIVEIGVGRRPEVALLLKDRFEVVVTDIEEQAYPGIRFVREDIFNPDIKTYEGASLIYSIRPPIDIQQAIAEVAAKVGADLLIRPFAQEKAELGEYFKECNLINHGRARFYLYRKPEVKEKEKTRIRNSQNSERLARGALKIKNYTKLSLRF